MGRGAQSIVFLARDLVWLGPGETAPPIAPDEDARAEADHAPPIGPWVALKLLTPKARPRGGVAPTALLRMRAEADALAALDHPSVIRLVHAGSDGPWEYLALEYAPGRSLASIVATDGARDPLEVAEWGAQLAEGLASAHALGILHRDLKPGNILIQEDGTPRLLDFGMARVHRMFSDVDKGMLIGTLPYMAPEAWGALPTPVDGRADLYGLAATLYEVATGRRAFPGNDPEVLLQAHWHGPDGDPRDHIPDFPPAFAEVLVRALRRQPAERYQTASGFAADLRRVVETGGRVPLPLRRTDRVSRLAAAARAVGRSTQRRELFEALTQASRGHGRVVLLEAAPGGGRTRFVLEMAGAVRSYGGLLITGVCHGFDHSLPFDGVVQALAHFRAQLRHLPRDERKARMNSVRARLVGRNVSLLRLLPTFREILRQEPPEPGADPVDFSERRFGNTLRDAALATGVLGRPTILFVDDVHRADEAGWDLLHSIAASIEHSAVVLLVSCPIPRAGRDPRLVQRLGRLEATAAKTFRRIVLPPLDESQVALFLRRALGLGGDETRGLAAWIHRLTGGHPQHLVGLVRTLEDGGVLTASDSGWKVDPSRLSELELASGLEAGVVRSVDSLAAEDRLLLGGAALLGPVFDVPTLTRIFHRLGHPPASTRRAINAGVGAGLVTPEGPWASGRAAHRFHHDCIRERLSESWPAEARATFHSVAADLIRGDVPPARLPDAALFAAARHGLQGTTPALAVPVALRAGARALMVHAPETAVVFFRGGLEAATAGEQRSVALEGLGRALLAAGRSDEALSRLDRLEWEWDQAGPEDRERRAGLRLLRAEVRQSLGHHAAADRELRSAAELLKRAYPTTRFGLLWRLAHGMVRHRLLLGSAVASTPDESAPGALLELELDRVGALIHLSRRSLLGVFCALRGFRTAVRARVPRSASRLGGVLALMFGMVFGRLPDGRRTLDAAERSGSSPASGGLIATVRGALDLLAWRVDDGTSRLEAAQDEQLDVDQTLTLASLGALRGDSGDLRGAWDAFETLYVQASAGRPDVRGMAWAAIGLAWVAHLEGWRRRALEFADVAVRAAGQRRLQPLLAVAHARRACIRAAAADPEGALADLDRAAQIWSRREIGVYFSIDARLAGAEAAVLLGDVARARRLLPSASEARRLPVLAERRAWVVARTALDAGRGSSRTAAVEAARVTAFRAREVGRPFEAARMLAAIYDRTGGPADRAACEEALRACPGASDSELHRRFFAEEDEEELTRRSAGISKHLARIRRRRKAVRSKAVVRPTVEWRAPGD